MDRCMLMTALITLTAALGAAPYGDGARADSILNLTIVDASEIPANPSGPIVVAVGGFLKLDAVAGNLDGSQNRVTAVCSWFSSDSSIAALDAVQFGPGIVKGIAAGTVTISAGYGGTDADGNFKFFDQEVVRVAEATVPEPSAILLVMIGLLAAVGRPKR